MNKLRQSDKVLKVLVMVSTKEKEASGEIVDLKAKVKALEMATIHATFRVDRVKMTTAPPEEDLDELMDLLGSSDLSGRQEPSRLVTPEKARSGGECNAQLEKIVQEFRQCDSRCDHT